MSRLLRSLFPLFSIRPTKDHTDLHEGSDRRKAPRFKTDLVVQWVGGSGVVTNISSTGVRFETEDELPADDKKMKFTFVIPDEALAHEHPRC